MPDALTSLDPRSVQVILTPAHKHTGVSHAFDQRLNPFPDGL